MDKLWKDKKSIALLSITFIFVVGLIAYAWIFSTNTKKDLAGFEYGVPLTIGSIFLLTGSGVVFWLVCVKKAEMSTIYLTMSFVVLSLFLWTQTPLHHHDNQFHYDSTYVLSNIIMGQETEVGIAGGKVKSYTRRECDKFMHYSSYNSFITFYADMQKEMFQNVKAENTKIVETRTYQGAVSEPLYFYLPQAIGFTIARLLNLNVYWLLYLGRLFLAAASVLLTWRAIKNTPVFKEIFLLCGMIPTTIWSYVTVSRDALILAFSFYVTSKCLQITYSKEKIKWWDYGLLFGALLLLAPYKFVYIPLVLLLALIIYRKRERGFRQRKIWLLVGAAVAVVAVFFILINFDYIKTYLTGANRGALGEGAPFTIPYILSNIGKTIAVVLKTMATSTHRYVANMIAIGDYGGGIHKEMVVVELLFIFIILCWNNQPSKRNVEIQISFVERGIMILTWLAISGMIYLAYLMLTPCTNDVIMGIQGRYFTPALPLMLISVCNINYLKKIRNKYWVKIMNRLDDSVVRQGVLLGIYGLALFVAVNMYVWVMTYVHPV